jgi:hypothetical protein
MRKSVFSRTQLLIIEESSPKKLTLFFFKKYVFFIETMFQKFRFNFTKSQAKENRKIGKILNGANPNAPSAPTIA